MSFTRPVQWFIGEDGVDLVSMVIRQNGSTLLVCTCSPNGEICEHTEWVEDERRGDMYTITMVDGAPIDELVAAIEDGDVDAFSDLLVHYGRIAVL